MTSTNIENLEKSIKGSVDKCCCNCNVSSPLLTTGLVVGSALTTATILSPRIRKVTLPIAKFALKQQMKALVGLGILSIATYISCPLEESSIYLDE